MTPAERQLISNLFDRLATLEDAQRDPDAERAIKDGLRQAPNAVYALVQTHWCRKRRSSRRKPASGSLSSPARAAHPAAPVAFSTARSAGSDNRACLGPECLPWAGPGGFQTAHGQPDAGWPGAGAGAPRRLVPRHRGSSSSRRHRRRAADECPARHDRRQRPWRGRLRPGRPGTGRRTALGRWQWRPRWRRRQAAPAAARCPAMPGSTTSGVRAARPDRADRAATATSSVAAAVAGSAAATTSHMTAARRKADGKEYETASAADADEFEVGRRRLRGRRRLQRRRRRSGRRHPIWAATTWAVATAAPAKSDRRRTLAQAPPPLESGGRRPRLNAKPRASCALGTRPGGRHEAYIGCGLCRDRHRMGRRRRRPSRASTTWRRAPSCAPSRP